MQSTEDKLSWYEVPNDVKELLFLASENWENKEKSQEYMQEALAKAGENLDVLVGAYRYFFYKSNASMALEIAEKVMNKVKEEETLPDDWEQIKPILIARQDEEIIRLYKNAYAATGYLLAKTGNKEEALIVAERVKEIDSKRESCATTVFEVLTKPDEEEE